MKKILVASFVSVLSLASFAQSGTNSPYSQYGLGVLSDQTSGFNRGMNGLGVAFHESNQVNFLNPASYAYVDSLSMIFDAGISGQITNFEEKGTKINANNASFEYVVASFRLAKRFGVSFGLLPFTNIGYSYSNSANIGSATGGSVISYVNTYSGTGGLHQIYLGLGWSPFKGFSIGVNGSYLWGDYERSVINSYSDNYVNTLSKYYTASVKNYKVDFGMQYSAKIASKDELTIGATYSLGHNLKADPECLVISKNPQTSVADSAVFKISNGLELPDMYAVGLAYTHGTKWKVGADYSLQTWSKIKAPTYQMVNNTPSYFLAGNMYNDRHKVTVGGEFCPAATGRNFFGRIRYRIGASYATPYLKINGIDGPKEYSVSAGFGVPIMNRINNRSMLNISAQWVRQASKQFITENTFRINIGITFNERWFAKWKVE